MNRRQLLASSVAFAAATSLRGGAALASPSCPVLPATRKTPDRIVQLGRVRVDDYAWLKDPDWKAVWRDPERLHPDIRAHLEQENAYAEAMLAPSKALSETLFAEIKALTPPDQADPPQSDGPYVYFQRFDPGAQHPAYLRRPRAGGPEEVLLDLDAIARVNAHAGRGYLAVSTAAHSPDHRLFAWTEDNIGSENFTLQVKDLETGEVLPDPAQQAYGDFVFSADSQWLFWTWRSADSRPTRVFRRPARGGPDVLVYEETDPAFLMQLSRTASNAYVMIRVWNADTSEVRLIPAGAPTSTPRLVEPRRKGLLYSLEHWNDRFAVLTNADGAVDFQIMWADETDPSRRKWRTWIAPQQGRFIIAMRAFRDHFVRVERIDANPVVTVTDRRSLTDRPVRFDEAAYTVALNAGDEYDTSILRLIYQSPRTPRRWLDLDMASGARTVTRSDRIAGGYDPARYVVERLFARAEDGAEVPITVLRRRDTRPDGQAPLMLYAYGSYGFSVEPEFSAANLALVDRGWIYAIAHVRGGSEKGWSWFLAARREHKKTTFTDFIACAEHLGAQGYGAKGRMVPYGLSAGGLLVGAVLNMRPDLWAAAIGQVPFVDMLNTMSDASHPLVPLTRPDWGDPLADPAAYDYIASYSPYDNVEPKPYPPVLATGSVADDRVGYWEPAKWVAKLRERSTSGAPMLLEVDMHAGHHGEPGRFETLQQQARLFAFAMQATARDWPCSSGA